MSKYRALVLTAFMAFVAAGASSTTDLRGMGDRSNPLPRMDRVQLDERGMVAAVGAEPVRAYRLDGGYGLHFHTMDLPAFVIEYRADRTKVAWMHFDDDMGLHGPANNINRKWALRVLSYSIGSAAAHEVMEAVAGDLDDSFTVYGHRVEVVAGGPLTLVTIFH